MVLVRIKNESLSDRETVKRTTKLGLSTRILERNAMIFVNRQRIIVLVSRVADEEMDYLVLILMLNPSGCWSTEMW